MRESPQESLGDLAVLLGFQETSALSRLRHDIVQAKTLDEAITGYREYSRLGQTVMEELKSADARGTAQIGLSVALARIWRGWGDNDRFIEALIDILDRDQFSEKKEIPHEAAQNLKELLANAKQDRREVKELLNACKAVISQEDLGALKDRPLDYVMAEIYPLLYGVGEDADVFLQKHGFKITASKDVNNSV